MPITWQNVNNRAGADPSQAINSAASLFNNAFAGLNGVMQKKEAIDASNWQNEKVNNTNAAMNELMKHQSAGDWTDAVKGGALDQIYQKYGAQVDQQALQKFADSRLTDLQQRDQATWKYDSENQMHAQRPVEQDILAAAARGDTATANELLKANPNLYNAANLQKQVMDQSDVFKVRGQRDQRFTDDLLTSGVQRQHLQTADKNDTARVGIQQTEASTNQFRAQTDRSRLTIEADNNRMARDDRSQAALDKKYQQLAGVNGTTLDSVEGMQDVTSQIEKMPIDDKQKQSLLRGLSEMSRFRIPLTNTDGSVMKDKNGNPMTVGMSSADAMKALTATKDDRIWLGRWMNNNSTQGEDSIPGAKAISVSQGAAEQARIREGIKQNVLSDIARIKARQKDGMVASPFGSGSHVSVTGAQPVISNSTTAALVGMLQQAQKQHASMNPDPNDEYSR